MCIDQSNELKRMNTVGWHKKTRRSYIVYSHSHTVVPQGCTRFSTRLDQFCPMRKHNNSNSRTMCVCTQKHRKCYWNDAFIEKLRSLATEKRNWKWRKFRLFWVWCHTHSIEYPLTLEQPMNLCVFPWKNSKRFHIKLKINFLFDFSNTCENAKNRFFPCKFDSNNSWTVGTFHQLGICVSVRESLLSWEPIHSNRTLFEDRSINFSIFFTIFGKFCLWIGHLLFDFLIVSLKEQEQEICYLLY